MYTAIGIVLMIGLIYLFGWIIKPIHYIPGLVVGVIIGLLLNVYENDIMAALTLFFVFIYPIITLISKHYYKKDVKDIIIPYPVTCPRCGQETLHTSYTKSKPTSSIVNKYYCINMCYNDDCNYYDSREISYYDWLDNIEFWKIKYPK